MSTAAEQRQDLMNIDSFGDESIELAGPSAMSAETRAEVDVQISTAKRFPRDLHSFKQQAMAMATFDEEIASGCFYSMPRSGKAIEGPSVRLAEIVLSAWGNIRSDARVIDVGEKELTAEAMTWDLEKNVAIRVQVKRRITDKWGKRYNDDMIVVTGNAACSIALRNSVFKVIPMVYTKTIYQAARQVAIGDAKTLASKRAEMVAYFQKMGVTDVQVFAAVGKSHLEDIGLDELATLKGFATAIKDGDVSVDEVFPPVANGKNGKKAEGPQLISEEQRTALVNHAKAMKVSTKDLGTIVKDAGFDLLANIPADKYDAVHTAITDFGQSPPATGEEQGLFNQDAAAGEQRGGGIDAEESRRLNLLTAIDDRLKELTGGEVKKLDKLLEGRDLAKLTTDELRDFLSELEGKS